MTKTLIVPANFPTLSFHLPVELELNIYLMSLLREEFVPLFGDSDFWRDIPEEPMFDNLPWEPDDSDFWRDIPEEPRRDDLGWESGDSRKPLWLLAGMPLNKVRNAKDVYDCWFSSTVHILVDAVYNLSHKKETCPEVYEWSTLSQGVSKKMLQKLNLDSTTMHSR